MFSAQAVEDVSPMFLGLLIDQNLANGLIWYFIRSNFQDAIVTGICILGHFGGGFQDVFQGIHILRFVQDLVSMVVSGSLKKGGIY